MWSFLLTLWWILSVRIRATLDHSAAFASSRRLSTTGPFWHLLHFFFVIVVRHFEEFDPVYSGPGRLSLEWPAAVDFALPPVRALGRRSVSVPPITSLPARRPAAVTVHLHSALWKQTVKWPTRWGFDTNMKGFKSLNCVYPSSSCLQPHCSWSTSYSSSSHSCGWALRTGRTLLHPRSPHLHCQALHPPPLLHYRSLELTIKKNFNFLGIWHNLKISSSEILHQMKPTFSPFLGTFASGHSWLLSTLMVFRGTLLFLLVWFTSLTLALRLWMKTHMEVSSQPLPWISCPWVFFMNYLRIIDNWTWPNRSVLHGRHKKHTICHLHTLKKTQKQLKFILHSLWQIMYVYLNLKCLTLFPLEHTCHMKTIGPFFFFLPDVEAALDSSSEELWPELLLRLLLARSGADTLAEVDLVTEITSTFSWVLTAAFFWLQTFFFKYKRLLVMQRHLVYNERITGVRTVLWQWADPAAVVSSWISDCGAACHCSSQQFCTRIWLFWISPRRRQKDAVSCCKSTTGMKEKKMSGIKM